MPIARELKIDNGTVVQRVCALGFTSTMPPAPSTPFYATQGSLPGLQELLTDNASLFDLIANHYSIATSIERLKITAGIAGAPEANLLDSFLEPRELSSTSHMPAMKCRSTIRKPFGEQTHRPSSSASPKDGRLLCPKSPDAEHNTPQRECPTISQIILTCFLCRNT